MTETVVDSIEGMKVVGKTVGIRADSAVDGASVDGVRVRVRVRVRF
jgi:hypothetical protein